MNLSILNSLCYTIGWFWCVLLGASGHSILALAGAILLILFQLYLAKKQDLGLYIQNLLLVMFSIPLGFLLELFFTQTHLIHYPKSFFPPIWIISLYPLFALLINHSLKIIKKSYMISFLLGFFGAPLSYSAGSFFGGLTFPYPPMPTWIAIGISWGLFLCLLAKIGNILKTATDETLEDRDSHLKLLYDGDCPICRREICMLQNRHSQVNFIDIAAKEYLSKENQDIDYATAMAKIHAIDSQGNVLIGIPAFAAVYARSSLLVTSTLLRIPFVRVVLDPLYRLFAKNRLRITGRN